ncbi:MAG: aminomethyl-transferring glycine dehydrogenase subunit GcvPA [Aquificae bacterium]|nr:aminomethyl-transferring glycine dehydrogenase subunit GcvPA [Aquificota bacterium]
MSYEPHTPEEERALLEFLGLKSADELFAHVPKELSARSFNLPEPKSEEELRRYFYDKAGRVKTPVCFAGAGAYDRIVPSPIWQLLNRGEFLTPYTPYQPEASQGILQALFEYQSMVCELTGMDAANASLYDGASATAEAVLMLSSFKKGYVLLPESLNPLYARVVKTYLKGPGLPVKTAPIGPEGTVELNELERLLPGASVLVLQQPNFLGYLEPLKEVGELCERHGVPLAVVADPVALALLKPPAAFGAWAVVGEGQPLGVPLSFGGPYAGFFAVRKELIRKMPGRLVGLARDRKGRRAFTLVLQTREQHVRRERATSNVCTSQTLIAIANAMYLTLLGPEGLKEVARQSVSKAYYLKNELLRLGFTEPFTGRHLWEFPLLHESLPGLHRELLKEGFLFGVPLGPFYPELKNAVLLAVTEKRTRDEMDRLVETVKHLA